MARSRKNAQKNIETHPDKERLNNPPVGLVTPDTDKDAGRKTYVYAPHLDPQLHWAGKAEHTSFAVPTVSLHVHERIDPCSLPIRSTGDMVAWYTGKPCEYTARSHINFCIYDSTWEASEAFELDHNPLVEAWVKNDHLGFEVFYVHHGVVRKYRPDFIIRLKSGNMLVLETKGWDSGQNRTKRRFLDEWVKAVNSHRGCGRWSCDVSREPADIRDILARHVRSEAA